MISSYPGGSFFIYGNEHLHNKHKKQQSPGTITIMGARDTIK